MMESRETGVYSQADGAVILVIPRSDGTLESFYHQPKLDECPRVPIDEMTDDMFKQCEDAEKKYSATHGP